MFHLQQVIEKLLKAIILKRDIPVTRTHDLSRLAHIAQIQEIEGLLDLCESLTLFAVNGRYPGDLPEISRETAWQYFESAKNIRDELLNTTRN